MEVTEVKESGTQAEATIRSTDKMIAELEKQGIKVKKRRMIVIEHITFDNDSASLCSSGQDQFEAHEYVGVLELAKHRMLIAL